MSEDAQDETITRRGERHHPKKRDRGRLVLGIVVGAVAVVAIVASITPWPSAMLIRSVFEKGGDETAAEMDRHVPDTELTETLNVAYGADGADTTMDVFAPASATGPLPTVVWIHGGAWISGSKENVDPYMRILASEGYTAIAVNYTIGPEGVYPTAVKQLNEALAYIDQHAEELGVDPAQLNLRAAIGQGPLGRGAFHRETAQRLAPFVGNHLDGRTQVQRAKAGIRRNRQRHMAAVHVFIRHAKAFGAKEEGHAGLRCRGGIPCLRI